MTESVLRQYEASGRLPDAEATSSLQELLSQSGRGDYLAIMAYLRQTPEVDRALELLRRGVQERYGIATTLGYGPRFLHSTGQLHKGSPRSGLFLQLDEAHDEDLPIPGRPYTFSVLATAQALGDLNALQAAGRRVAKVHLGSGGASSILTLASELG
jgi:glucose-6-phosphate isomerase/transaldolase/glucose-6-phosphate isomerase